MLFCCSEVNISRSLLHLLQAGNASFAVHASHHCLLKGKTIALPPFDEVSTCCLIAVRAYSLGSAVV